LFARPFAFARPRAFQGRLPAAANPELAACMPSKQKNMVVVEPKKKRQRCCAQPPFHSMLHTKGGKSMRISIDVPAADEQCPLTMSAISEDCLDFIPGETYIASMPEARKIILPCGHGFGAMSITYHFARRDMRCPCCRAGHKQKMSAESIPFHFRAKLVAHVEAAEQEDVDEQTREDERVALELGAAGSIARMTEYYVDALQEIIENRAVKMTVFFYGGETAEAPFMFMLFNMTPIGQTLSAVTRDVSFRLIDDHCRELRRQIEENQTLRVSFVAHSRSMSNERVVELARTEIFQAQTVSDDQRVNRLIPTGTSSEFEILRLGEPSVGDPVVLYHMRLEEFVGLVM
jgi:hypothetical protein